MFTGQSLATTGNKRLEGAKSWVKAQGEFKKALETEAKNNGAAIDWLDKNGNFLFKARYEEIESAIKHAGPDGIATWKDEYGVSHSLDTSNTFVQSYMDDMLKAQVADYQAGNVKQVWDAATGSWKNADTYQQLISQGQKLFKVHEEAVRTSKDVDTTGIDPAVAANFGAYNPDDIKTYGKAIGAANAVISSQENTMEQIMRRANNQQKKNGGGS